MSYVGIQAIIPASESKGCIESILESKILCIRGSNQLAGRKIKFVGPRGI